MKVGGNESATKFFRANGGSAALNSKDPKTKYTSSAATKYKEELKRRAARDAEEYPNEVVITETGDTSADGSSTPAGEPEDDFFSSWDKPAIKKPTPPVSRTATPPVVGRTPSPFLAAGSNGKDIARSASPLSKVETADDAKPATTAAPTASRITTSAALRKTSATGGAAGPKKANILGAKKVGPKLGAKKLGASAEVIDFDEAEKKAKEEAERIAKLGYDPDAEEAKPAAKAGSSLSSASGSGILSPTPVSPTSARGGYGSASHTREKSASEMERLGMGIGRLGFGQVGANKAAAGAKKSAGGFGSVGPIKAAPEGSSLKANEMCRCRRVSGMATANMVLPQRKRRRTRARSSARRRRFRLMSSLARVTSTRRFSPRRRRGCRASRARRPSRPTPTSAGPRRTLARPTTTATSRALPRT